MITYRGKRNTDRLRVVVDQPGRENDETWRSPLRLRTELVNHSPSFECGSAGSGPAQLAVAICADHLARHELRAQAAAVSLGLSLAPIDGGLTLADRIALTIHQDFKHRVVAALPRDGWDLTDDEVGAAINGVVAERLRRRQPDDDDAPRVEGGVL